MGDQDGAVRSVVTDGGEDVVRGYLLRPGLGAQAGRAARSASHEAVGTAVASLGFAIEFQFFGDDDAVRHLRVLMDTDDRRAAETCVDLNIQTWVAALETAVMMLTGRPFHVARMPGTYAFVVGLGEGTAAAPALIINPIVNSPPSIDYQRVAYGLSAWDRETQHHLFYFRRLVDDSLPLDVRWLNGYRLLEWHFVGDRAGLSRSADWRTFVARFEKELLGPERPGQTAVGLLEEARALAAHAGLDDRPEAERKRNPRNAMERTFRILEQMVITVLNEHPARVKHPVQFEPRVKHVEARLSCQSHERQWPEVVSSYQAGGPLPTGWMHAIMIYWRSMPPPG